MNEGWRWTTVVGAALALGCLLAVLMVAGFLFALFLSVAWTLSRPR